MTELDSAPSEVMHMDPNVWGPPLWDTLFTLCFKCPPSTLADLQTLFSLLEKVIPCQHCRRSYTMYRKQVRPSMTIKSEVPNSAAMWLWTIHDMVNQKLGKICISFDKLQQRYGAMTALTNDFTVLDLYCILAFATRPSIASYVVQFIEVVSRLSVHVPGLRIGHLTTTVRHDHLLEDLFEMHTRVREAHGVESLSREKFDAQYTSARAS